MCVEGVEPDDKPLLPAGLSDVSGYQPQDEHECHAQRLDALGHLAAGIVHDFNNLVGVIESGLRLIQTQIVRDPTSPKLGLLIEELQRRTQNGHALTQQLLSFSRYQPPGQSIVNLNERIRSLLGLLQNALGAGIAINFILDDSIPPVFIDPNQMDVAMLNLAINAKYAMSSSGTLTIETSNYPSAGFAVGPGAELVRLSVSDDGCGMSKDTMTSMFEPFFTTRSEAGGTGLGLSQVREFANRSGGYVEIESMVDGGTRIDLFLQIFDAEKPA